jgi:hypothetical protein
MHRVAMNSQFNDRRKRNIPLEDVARDRVKERLIGIGIGIIISGIFALILYNL